MAAKSKLSDFFYGTGRRKTATARVFMRTDGGKTTVNGKPLEEYFTRITSRMIAQQALGVAGAAAAAMSESEVSKDDFAKNFRFHITVRGGGESGQAAAVRHGITRALIQHNADLKPALRAAGLVLRDPREVERKKTGLHKARRAKQYSKR